MFPRIPLMLTAAAVLALPPAVGQAATNWSFNLQTDAPTSTTSGDANGYGNTRTYTSSGLTVSVGAYSNTGNNGSSTTSQDNSNANQIETANLAHSSGWQGLGAYNRDAGSGSGTDYQESISPEHSFDNNERADSALLSFGTGVNLTSITFGWWNTDSDFYVLAYTPGATDPATPTLTGLTYASLNGWTLVGNYSNPGASTGGGAFTTTLGTTLTSSYWLIGAGGFTAGTGVHSGDLSSGSYLALSSTSYKKKFDYLKLAGVGGTLENGGGTGGEGGSAPEPGSLALAGLAFVGMMGLRRRRVVA